MTVAITISYCADHSKGPPQWNHRLPAHEHASMLLDTVRYIKSEVPGAKVVLCVCGGFARHPDGRVLDTMDKSEHGIDFILTESTNPGYSEGATLAIFQAYAAASRVKAINADTILHTCEDVVPHPGECRRVLGLLATANYVGERWRPETTPLELSTQFFAARTKFLESWKYPSDMPPERQMGSVFEFEGRYQLIERRYEHTHDYAAFKGFMEKARGE